MLEALVKIEQDLSTAFGQITLARKSPYLDEAKGWCEEAAEALTRAIDLVHALVCGMDPEPAQAQEKGART